jgi:drug/metabolite transporter (DMT)-like permease
VSNLNRKQDAHRLRATLIGGLAVLLWALLALLTTQARGIPPFELLAITFGTAFVASLLWLGLRDRAALACWKLPPRQWALGVVGLFGYHFFYFVALGNAPAVEASLIAYLWPLLIVLFSALLPGQRLRWFHLAGTLAGLAGAVLIVGAGGNFSFSAEHTAGYAAAVACALIWSSYSVANNRLGGVPTALVGGQCGVVAVLALAAHFALEETVAPNAGQWVAALVLGIGPFGLSFFCWDYGTKHGNLPVLGAFSYAAPLLSTILLVLAGVAAASTHLALACGLIVGGSLLASAELWGGRLGLSSRLRLRR